MILKARYAALAGVVFLVLAVVYGLLSHDVGGVTMLGALGIAISLAALVLAAGSPRGDEQ
ncbi:MAG: hypothetical protein M0T75_07190 [Chloroflexi bacterium]|nr:hypothetical protein [Chloroflexota bacterium]